MPDACGEQASTCFNSGACVTGGQRPAVLWLEEVDVTAARDVVRVTTRAPICAVRSVQGQTAVANGASEERYDQTLRIRNSSRGERFWELLFPLTQVPFRKSVTRAGLEISLELYSTLFIGKFNHGGHLPRSSRCGVRVALWRFCSGDFCLRPRIDRAMCDQTTEFAISGVRE